MNLANKILSIDQNKIEQAIAQFEKEVDFEFIPVIARKSSYVEHISWVISLFFLVLLIPTIDYIFAEFLYNSWLSKWPFLLAAPFISFGVGLLLDKSDLVDRFFITKLERVRQVQEKAELFFYRTRLHQLHSKNALMLYVSVMERQIVLFHGPETTIPNIDEIENEMLKLLQASFKKSEYQQGILACVEHLRLKSGSSFLKNGHSHINALPNKLIWINE